jgi:hypothetical protein
MKCIQIRMGCGRKTKIIMTFNFSKKTIYILEFYRIDIIYSNLVYRVAPTFQCFIPATQSSLYALSLYKWNYGYKQVVVQ